MKFYAVPVLADYEFIGNGQSGGGEVTKIGIALAEDTASATKMVMAEMESLTKQSPREGIYSNLRPQTPKELSMDEAGFICFAK